MPQSSVANCIAALRERYPDSPFIALGQTVFWDEPVKAAWRVLLDQNWPDAHLVAGVHDTDYFAKTTALISTDKAYALLPHNDGATRGLWSAAGEMSALFGSEDVPARAVYESHGVPAIRLAEAYAGGKRKFYDDETAAWGWRGIVHTGSEPPISHDIPLREFAGALTAQLEWAFSTSLESIAPAYRDEARSQCSRIMAWVDEYIECCSDKATLSDMYQHMLPLLYQLLLQAPPNNLSVTSSVQLFQFNPATCNRPLFALVDLFLNPKTRGACREAYDSAVAGGGMYTLESFGIGAVPFDVVVPGRGRGTLRVTSSEVVIEWQGGPQSIATTRRPEDRAALAEILQAALGDNVVLVGKAVSLIDMLAGEFIVVFHETASGYTTRTVAMNDAIRSAGISLDMRPIVRLAYPTWDALASANVTTELILPPHLAKTFGTGGSTLPAAEFGRRWRGVVKEQREALKALRDLRKPREALSLLEGANDSDGPCWPCVGDEYEKALALLAENASRCDDMKFRMSELRDEIVEDVVARLTTETEKGADFRNTLRPLLDKATGSADDSVAGDLRVAIAKHIVRRAETFDATIDACRERITNARREIRRLRTACRAIERSPDALAARDTLARIENRVNMARLDLVRAAFLTSESLPHTQARPSAWWLPMVDPSGGWFRAIVDGTEARLEEL